MLPDDSNAIKLSGRTFLAPHRGSSPKGEARRYVANDFLNLIALPARKADDTRETCYQETFGHRPTYTPRRLDPSTQFSRFR